MVIGRILIRLRVLPVFSDTMDSALDKLELLQKNELKNSEALQKITGILSNFFDVNPNKRSNCSQDSNEGGCGYVA